MKINLDNKNNANKILNLINYKVNKLKIYIYIYK